MLYSMAHLPVCTVCRYVGQWQTGGRSWWSRHWGESLPETTPPPAAARNRQRNNLHIITTHVYEISRFITYIRDILHLKLNFNPTFLCYLLYALVEYQALRHSHEPIHSSTLLLEQSTKPVTTCYVHYSSKVWSVILLFRKERLNYSDCKDLHYCKNYISIKCCSFELVTKQIMHFLYRFPQKN